MDRRKIFLLFILFVASTTAYSATWERLYSMRSTDCFRNVKETSNGDFVLAGYTADLTSHDTDGIAIRMDDAGDTIWTFKYNGPNSKEDCFYKILPTSDGGFIICGYSRSFNGSDNAIYLKLSSSGHLQWVKNWGGSGVERAQDIVELSNGDFVMVGYTTSSPAHYYDAFILKIDDNGNTIWNKIYGWNNYDDANSLKLLSDGGFIIGGQSGQDQYLIRADQNGDTLWTKVFGTSGVDNIECVNFAQGGDGYVLAGHTDGPGNGGDNGYVIRTDTSGNIIWAKTYGGNDNNDFHRIEQTSDGGYVATGTSADGTWLNPNMWILKMDSNGNQDWERFYGGDSHDHGYGGQQTSDGGYILAGHTRSFGNTNYLEDALVVKTNSSGLVSHSLNYTTVTDIISPVGGGCASGSTTIKIEVTNYGEATVSDIPVTVEITGAVTQTLTQIYTSSIDRDESKTMTFTTTVDLSSGGTFNFHCYTGNQHDVIPARNYFDKTITQNLTSSPPTITNGSHCGPGSVQLTATSPDQVRWYANASGGNSLATGNNYNTPYLTSSSTYYAQAGVTCPSSRVAVSASISGGLTPPAAANQMRCGDGTLALTASSSSNVKWYNSANSNSSVYSGSPFTTPVLQNTFTFYVAADNGTCTSPRVAVDAIVNPMPADPVTTGASRCGDGTLQLSATGLSTIRWYASLTGSPVLSTGNSFSTLVLTQSATYYAESFDGTCPSNRISANAIVNPLPVINLGPDTIIASANSIDLDAGDGFSNYSWSTLSPNQIITINTDGYYCVTVTDTNNCMGTDCAYVQFPLLVPQFNRTFVNIYPNPTSDVLHISMQDFQNVHYTIFSADGKLIDAKIISRQNTDLDYSNLSSGFYIAKLTGENFSYEIPVIIN
jgi:hypothetical protein